MGNTAGAAVTGLAAGFTCGASLALEGGGLALYTAGAYGLSSMAGSTARQAITTGEVDPTQVAVDGAVGAVTAGTLKYVGDKLSNADFGFKACKGAGGTGQTSVKDLKVIGRLEDTAVAKSWKGYDVLDDPNWTLQKNDAWVNAGIKNKQNFYIASPLTKNNLVSANPKYPGATIFAREIDMLLKAGYVQKGDFFIHPKN